MTKRESMRAVVVATFAALLVAWGVAPGQPGPAQAAPDDAARQILDATGVRGGLVVHLGCGDGKLTAALGAGDGFLAHGLDADPANVEAAREHVRSKGLYGKVSIDRLAGNRLPYAENLVRLVVATEPGGVSTDEIARVLAPGGVAYVKEGEAWKKTVKPWPDDVDQWTHYLHDASGNAVAADEQVGPPRRLRWIAPPLWGRSHEFNPSVNALITAGGRLFYLHDEGIVGLPDAPKYRFPGRWSLKARDAASGVLLWKRPVPNWGYREWNTVGMWSAPLTLNRRVVTDGPRVYVTLGYKAPVTVIDAATGKTIRTIDGSMGTDEMVLDEGVLLLCVREQLSVAKPPGPGQTRRRLNPHEFSIGPPGDAAVVAVGAESGRELWRRDPQPVGVLTLAARGGRVCFHSEDKLVCLDLKTGEPQWTAPCRRSGGSRHAVGTLVMYDDVVLFTAGDGLAAFDAKSGERLWTGPRVSGPGISHPPDLFVADGLVWGGDTPGMHSRERTAVKRDGYDPRTGKVRRTIEVARLFSPLHHVRCYRSKATDRYLMLTKRGIEFFDLKGENHMRNDWIRAMCHYGFMPACGLLYIPSHHCFCYPGVRLNGFLALAAERDEGSGTAGEGAGSRQQTAPRLEKGPAYQAITPPASSLTPSHNWPTFRHDPARSGCAKTAVPTEVEERWQAELGGRLSQPVVAEGMLLVAQVDAQIVHAMDAATGRTLWTYTAGGRVDSPPTVHKGLVLFGCRDGWVYCLRASDGELAWRFRAAPRESRIVAFDRIESPWPVSGSVLVLEGVAYVCAGHSSFLDGGVYLYGLKPETGELLCRTRVGGPWPDVTKDVGRPFDMDGTRGDVLVTDAEGKYVYLFQMTFDKELKQVETPRASTLGDRKTGRHLMATGGLLEDVWFDRTYWTYSNRWPGFYFANDAPKAGQIVVFDESTTYGLHVFRRRARLSPTFTPGSEGYELFADDNDNEPVLAPNSINREKGPGFSRAAPPKWSKLVPLRAYGMVRAGDKLFLAGPPDVVPEDDPYASFDGRLGARLWVVKAADGEKLAEHPLETLPVFDGLIAAGGRLYLSSVDGTVTCFGSE